MTKIITTSKQEYETALTFQQIQGLIKSGNLVTTTSGEFINPHTIERIISPPQGPMMNYPVNNFHVPTEEEQRIAQEKLQPLKKIFDERREFDKNLLQSQRESINSQRIYGAENATSTKIETVMPVAEEPKKRLGRPKKGV